MSNSIKSVQDQFWDKIEAEFLCTIPNYLKNMLKYSGYESVYIIKTITEEDFQYLEDFVKNMKHFIEQQRGEEFADGVNFYHVFTPENFHIPNGHKRLLLEIAKYVKERLDKYGSTFFYPSKIESKRKNDGPAEGLRKIMRLPTCNNPSTSRAATTDSTMKPTSEPSLKPSSSILEMFVNSAERNSSRPKPGYRFDILIKMFAAYIKLLAGLLAYETLQANLPLSLPSTSTVNRFLEEKGPKVIEGVLRTTDLLEYLKSRNLPLVVSIAEDATRITPKISYDPNSNQLVGFSLPLDSNGMPIPFSFKARNGKEIENHFLNPSNYVSSTAYIQMVQALDPNTPPFCLIFFMIDNKFTTSNILKRWVFTKQQLKKEGISVHNFSSDGDARLLKAMIIMSQLGVHDPSFIDSQWYSCGGYSATTYTQDVHHIGTKARNLILKVSRILPIGDWIISNGHLKYLIQNVSKDKHLLSLSDIEPKDRQNFRSAEKICSEKSIQCLLDYVPGSEGTAMYLKAMNYVLSAHLHTIKSSDRIYKIWFAVFFFRIWRSWILSWRKIRSRKSKNTKKIQTQSDDDTTSYTLQSNFISSNCYTCIELNAHTLVKKLLKTTDESTLEQSYSKNHFFPNLYGSQTCEATFGQARALSSTFSTVVNFNTLEAINRIKKIQLLSDIINTTKGQIHYPRFEKKSNETTNDQPVELLTKSEIIMEIDKAKRDATCAMEKLGIKTSSLNLSCPIKAQTELGLDLDEESDEFESDTEDAECDENSGVGDLEDEVNEVDVDVHKLSDITGELSMRDYSDTKIKLNEDSPFAIVSDSTGKEIVVRKSSICWLLSKNKCKLSSDRLQRVQERDFASSITTNHGDSEESSQAVTLSDKYVVKSDVNIGDWCIWIVNEIQTNPRDPCMKLGLVLGFAYLNGKTFKESEYSKSCAPVKSDQTKGIGVVCSYYNFNDKGVLTGCFGQKKSEHTLTKIESYIATVAKPLYVNKALTIPNDLVTIIKALGVQKHLENHQASN